MPTVYDAIIYATKLLESLTRRRGDGRGGRLTGHRRGGAGGGRRGQVPRGPAPRRHVARVHLTILVDTTVTISIVRLQKILC